jgi:RNA polymerase sigma factor (TIGR02999 family)
MDKNPDITLLLSEWADGSTHALEQLSPLVYEELRKFAYRAFAREAGSHTLQPTALVNEVFIKLVDADVSWQGRSHFYALAARMMRRLLINYANDRNALKRGQEFTRVALEEEQLSGGDPRANFADLLALNEGLERLAQTDLRKVELIELQYFAGLTYREMEEVTGLSSSTLDRELRFARAWLKNFLDAN